MWFSDMAETLMSLKNVFLQAYAIKSVNTCKANKDGWKRFKLSHALISLLLKKNHTSKDNLPSRYGKKI